MRGGRPPRERSIKETIAASVGVLAHEKASELMLVELLSLNARKAAAVITKYVIKARNVRDGAN